MTKDKDVIAVTGGTGYVGSRTAVVLHERGHKVIVVDIIPPEERNITFPGEIEFRQADLRVPEEADGAFKGVDVIMHLAADIGALTYMHEHQAEILRNNSAIDAAVYPACIKNDVRHIVYSSSSMVFQYPPHYPYAEADLENINPPKNVYGYSKLTGEYFCRSYYEQYGLNYTILRYHNIYGPGEDSKGATPGDIHVIPALLEKVLIKKQYPIELLGDPKATRPFTFVDDAVDATVRTLEKVCASDEVVMQNDFNVGNDTYYSIEELARIIWENYGDSRPFDYVSVDTRANTALRREVDIARIREALDWEPKMTLEEGLPIVAEWIKNRS